MSGPPQKHSLTLQGHRTSVSLEPEFWEGLRALARVRGMALNRLAAEIDTARGTRGLASALRVAVLGAALTGELPPRAPASATMRMGERSDRDR
ncbi:MAG: ribbon-helix-helix domain-containing protein [Rubellimicrobium sp.]|nr:ribbon-helix-helix domain-containing protein [Rubellimicrobium sp.]